MSNLIEKLFEETGFPGVEGLYAESSNVNNDTACAYAITKVYDADESKRLEYLTKLLMLGKSVKPIVMSGYKLALTEKWTVPDAIICEHNEFKDKEFTIIWLESEVIKSEYHGNAGYSIKKLRGMVIQYPDEMKKTAGVLQL